MALIFKLNTKTRAMKKPFSSLMRTLAAGGVMAAALSAGTSRAAVAQTAPSVRRMAIATHALARGEVLSADDIEFRDTTMRALLDTNQVATGWVTRRARSPSRVGVRLAQGGNRK